MKNVVRFLLRRLFRLMKIRVFFMETEEMLPQKGIYIANHVSWLDPIVLFAFLPKDPVLLLHSKLYKNKVVRFFLKTANVMEFNYMNAQDAKKVIDLINQDKFVLMFPEGCMTDSGDIMKIYEAPAVISDRTGAPFIPIWIAGAEYSPFSETEGNQPHRLLPKIKITVGKTEVISVNEELKKNRDYLRDVTYHILNRLRFQKRYSSKLTLPHALLRTARIYGKVNWLQRRKVLEDIQRQPQSYFDLIVKAHILGKKFAEHTKVGEKVALMLPNSVASVVSFFALSFYGRIPAMLNFSHGPTIVVSMCRTVQAKVIITSKAFIVKGKMEGLVEVLKENKFKVLYLEDLAKTITLKDKIAGYLAYKFRRIPVATQSTDTAVILFTSGSEGAPKAVLLSHSNILSNVQQTICFEQLMVRDLMFNSLPMFHSFGLTVGTFYPLFNGAKVFLFPSPLMYRSITELLYELRATIMVATDTFYKVYAKISHPYDFKHVRLCYAGAEAVKQETRDMVSEKLGKRLMEGYGTTECAPIICVNNYLFNKFGTLGKLPPALEYKIEPVAGIKKGGELCVRGPNVMKGYMFASNPGVLVPVENGWYHTGDVVEVDDLGFVKIVDRVKRFAKIAGEMISLTAVENLGYEIWKTEDFHCGAVAIPHPKKGEQIVFVSNNPEAGKPKFSEKVQKKAMSELYVPSLFLYREEMPLLATGKADVQTLKKWVLEQTKE